MRAESLPRLNALHRWRRAFALILLGPAIAWAGASPQWNASFLGMHGPTGPVGPMAVWDDGGGAALYAGAGSSGGIGLFSAAGGLRTPYIARWNGSGWSALAEGLDATPNALVAFGDRLVAGGNFRRAGTVAAAGVAAWDGRRWSRMGRGFDSVRALAVFEGQLYAAGTIIRADSSLAFNVGRWNGRQWDELGLPANSLIWDMVVHQDTLVAGGWFSQIGGVLARVAAWNGEQWSQVGGIGPFEHLAVHGQELIAGGARALLSSSQARIARFDGLRWQPVEFLGNALALGSHAGDLLVGTSYGGLAIATIPPYGAPWQGGTDTSVRAMLVHDGRLYVSGSFARAGSIQANRIAAFDDAGWQALGAGLDGPVLDFVDFDGDLVIGGRFRGAAGNLSQGVLRWDGEQWVGLGAGFQTDVYDLAIYDGELVAAGLFPGLTYGGSVRRWDGQQWVTLGTGMDREVVALAEYAGLLVAAGSFSDANGVAVDKVAAWDGQAWHAMGSPPLSQVSGLIVHDGQLHALGSAETGGTPVARWDGQAWTQSGPVYPALWMGNATIFEGDLVVAGNNSSAFPDAPRVQRLRGGVWEPMGALDINVSGLAVHAGELYAAGSREDGGDVPVMRWNGSDWEPFGPEVDLGIAALGVYQGQLLAGGSFSRFGDRVLPYIAAYGPAYDTSVAIVGVSVSPAAPGQAIELSVEISADIAPTRGHVTITGHPGGSCTDLTLEALDGTRALARCSITWTQGCNRELVADYVGASSAGTVWQSSRSQPIVLPMIGEPTCSEFTLFADDFE